MSKNVGIADKAGRVIIAVAICTLFALKIISGLPGIILLAVAIILFVTALFNFCPLYKILGISTCKK